MSLSAGRYSIALDRPQVMGVLNVTPDSFSDGGKFLVLDDAIRHAEKLVGDGASIIDVGGESTRPGSTEVTVQKELDRVLPVIEAISDRFDVPVSVDTNKPVVMRDAISAGAAMINDVYALRRRGAMEVVASHDIAVCLMHMQGTPADMQAAPSYEDVVTEVCDFLRERLTACLDAGISQDRLMLDPGFGFGKNDSHNLDILANLDQFTILGAPLLIGLSRKQTLGSLPGCSQGGRAAASIAAAVFAVGKGARIVRTHDVAGTVDALKVITQLSTGK
jgi:dihydropteroate synthase